MKKITSVEPITFAVDGSTTLEIDSEGCLASDAAAAIAKERLGDVITVVETSVEEAVNDVTADAGPTLADLKEEAKDLGLAVSGNKADLIARIAEYKATVPAGNNPPADVVVDPAA